MDFGSNVDSVNIPYYRVEFYRDPDKLLGNGYAEAKNSYALCSGTYHFTKSTFSPWVLK